jgi:MraZ protein
MGLRTTLSHFYPLSATIVSAFLGRYDFQMDEKGRVSLPAAFRRGADGDRFILVQLEGPALTLYPMQEWEKLQESLLRFRKTSEAAENYVRRVTSNAVEVSPDKQGRILIPSWLQEAASLKGTVVLSGVLDKVEIWDPEEFKKRVQDTPDGFEDVGELRRQVFG